MAAERGPIMDSSQLTERSTKTPETAAEKFPFINHDATVVEQRLLDLLSDPDFFAGDEAANKRFELLTTEHAKLIELEQQSFDAFIRPAQAAQIERLASPIYL